MSHRLWLRILALIVFLVVPACGRSAEFQRIGHTKETGVTLACTAKGQWKSRSTIVGRRLANPERLSIYLDVSEPIGGFLPMSPGGEISAFKTLVNSLPGRLVTMTGATRQKVEWKTFGEDLRSPRSAPNIDRPLFGAGATRLDLAITDAVQGLSSGKVGAAIVVTDLVATGDVIGAAGAAKPLLDWLSSEPVRSGQLHVGLLGVRAPYWGVLARACRPVKSGLGCWFSERTPGYKPLAQRALVPFYLLIFGRDAAAIEQLGTSLAADASKRKLATQWELLTAAARPLPARLECTAHEPGDEKGRQYALFRGPEGQIRCRRDEEVELSCRLSEVGIALSSVIAPGSWPEVKVKSRGAGAVITVDCERIRDRETTTTDLDLTLDGVRGSAITKRWQEWSSDTDEEASSLGRTLDLDRFLERVRLTPESWEIDCEPLFRGGSGGGT